MTQPAAPEEGQGSEDCEGDDVPIGAENHLVHANIKHGLGQHMIASIHHLHQRHPQVRPQHLVPRPRRRHAHLLAPTPCLAVSTNRRPPKRRR